MVTADPTSLGVQRIAYGSDPEQFGDLRLPRGAGPHPTIVYVHGGGWSSSVTLAGAAGICSALTERGFATWSLEYRRLGNGGGWPATFDDVLAGARYVATLAGEAPLDVDQTFVAGQSAGGQLAIWLAHQSRSNPAAGLPSFRRVIALAPASDLRATAAKGRNAAVPLLLGGTPEQVPERYAAVSPIELLPLGLPQLVVHGTADTIVSYALSDAYVSAARAAGDEVEFVTIEGAEHLDLWNAAAAAFPRVIEAAASFVRGRHTP